MNAIRPNRLPLLLLTVAVSAARAEEIPTETKIESVGLFKNGLGVVTETLEVDAPGVYRLDDVPTPVHGTFWIESDANITTRATKREVTEKLKGSNAIDFQQDLVDRQVIVHFTDGGIPPATGTVLELEESDEGNWNRTYQQPRHYYNQWNTQTQPGTAGFLILKTDDGRVYIDRSRIAYLKAIGAGEEITRKKPVLLITVPPFEGDPPSIRISYLSKGIAWAPSYRVDISDPDRLTISQKAIIKNELRMIDAAEMRLISGFPNVQFSHVTSPLDLDTTWTSFFSQLNQSPQSGHLSLSNIATQQGVSFNSISPNADGIDLSATPSGEGVDLHYQSIGEQTMEEGDSLATTIASGKADYDRIVEWIVPDTRSANGRHISEHERNQNPEKHNDAAWDAVRFKNPFEFPMTTAPAMVVSKGAFNGQRMSYWVNSNEETTLHVTKALSVRTRNTEHESQTKNRQTVYIGSHEYRKVSVNGELVANNHRNETIQLVIRRRFSGDLDSADGDPKTRLLEEGVYSVNRRNELIWTVELKPGEEIKLGYNYTVLVY